MRIPYNKDWARTHRCGELRAEHAGEEVVVNGWVHRRRDLGGLIFIDLRDRAGIVQVKCDPQAFSEVAAVAKDLRGEFVIGVRGNVVLRGEGNRNAEMATGDVEIEAGAIALFNESATPPFEPKEETSAGEELRLEYRFLDLRRPGLQANLILRHVATLAARNFFSEEGFIEIETPILTRSTPEGARDFLVPSRVNKGRFYALPQSPQLFKQLLMISGMDRYVQVARCFRDEDLRANRQLEFTQIDVEMAFVEPDDIFDVVERLMVGLYGIIGREAMAPFPVMDYDEAMNRFGSDKPDLRFGMELVDLSEKAAGISFRIFSETVKAGGVVKGLPVPGGANLSRKQLDEAEELVKAFGAKGLAWVKWGAEGFSGPAAKFLGDELCEDLFAHGGCEPGAALLMVADRRRTACTALGALRLQLARVMEIVDESLLKFLWVVDFPLFEEDENGKPTPVHHPFTAPHPDDVDLLESEPLKVRSRAYDLVLNGEEIGGGSIRIHDRDVQQRVFNALGIGEQEAKAKFGFLLDALTYGAPPHGGIALGWDRITAMLAGEEAIRSVIAFPKTTSGLCLMTKAPAEVDPGQLAELGIKLSRPKPDKKGG
jgi:aspartyl-tRNA synthetase